MRSQDYQPLAVALLENYLSDSSVGADEDSDPEVGDDETDQPEASSATRPWRKTRAATAKQSSSRVAATVEAAKTAKFEAAKKKRKTIPTPVSRDVEDEVEATDDLPVIDDHVVPMSPSPTTKKRRARETGDGGGPLPY